MRVETALRPRDFPKDCACEPEPDCYCVQPLPSEHLYDADKERSVWVNSLSLTGPDAAQKRKKTGSQPVFPVLNC